MKRRNSSVLAGRPCTSTRQEKLAGCPAKTRDNVSAPESERASEIVELHPFAFHAGCREGQGVGNPA